MNHTQVLIDDDEDLTDLDAAAGGAGSIYRQSCRRDGATLADIARQHSVRTIWLTWPSTGHTTLRAGGINIAALIGGCAGRRLLGSYRGHADSSAASRDEAHRYCGDHGYKLPERRWRPVARDLAARQFYAGAAIFVPHYAVSPHYANYHANLLITVRPEM